MEFDMGGIEEINICRCYPNIQSRTAKDLFSPSFKKSIAFSESYSSLNENGRPRKKQLYIKYDNGNSNEALDLLNQKQVNGKLNSAIQRLKLENGNMFTKKDFLRQSGNIERDLDMLYELKHLQKSIDHKLHKAKAIHKTHKKHKHVHKTKKVLRQRKGKPNYTQMYLIVTNNAGNFLVAWEDKKGKGSEDTNKSALSDNDTKEDFSDSDDVDINM